MFVPRIYFAIELQKNQSVSLDEPISHYINKVLRLKEGDDLILFNGQGGEYLAKLSHKQKRVIVNIIEFRNINRESPLHIHLGQGIARSERMDYVIQKNAELGANEISPLLSQRSLIKLDDNRKHKRQAHWEKVAISAAEQSFRTNIPTIHTPISLKEWAMLPFDGLSIYCDTTNTKPLQSLAKHERIRIAIGPESGWSEEESTFLAAHDFVPISLGPRILRTETAGVVVSSILQGLWGDLSDTLSIAG